MSLITVHMILNAVVKKSDSYHKIPPVQKKLGRGTNVAQNKTYFDCTSKTNSHITTNY